MTSPSLRKICIFSALTECEMEEVFIEDCIEKFEFNPTFTLEKPPAIKRAAFCYLFPKINWKTKRPIF